MTVRRLIESDDFPFEFLSQLAQRESWRKEAFRPVYYLHKWWAKRLGSVFRGIILGSLLPEGADLVGEFYRPHSFSKYTIFDPFMGSGVTIGEAHKLGLTSLGRDINSVAFETVRVALGPLDRTKLEKAFETLSQTVGKKILALYTSKDSSGNDADSLYYFWVMQTNCPNCSSNVDLFPSRVVARNAYPTRKPQIQLLCPYCDTIFSGLYGQEIATCVSCARTFSPSHRNADGAKATCSRCNTSFTILESFGRADSRPHYRLYGRLVLTSAGKKEYLSTSEADLRRYQECSVRLNEEVRSGKIKLPMLRLETGYNTEQAMKYGFSSWRDFFNDRQLLALGWLQAGIATIEEESVRDALMLIFSGMLEFNNMFASYKGEGTGAVRHMFSHHILKPERTPIEANVWGTPRSSGSFSTLFRRRLLTAISYRDEPTEFELSSGKRIACSQPFTGKIESLWPTEGKFSPRAIYLSTGDSSETGLPDNCIDLIVTDPPFFDNVNYSELADFFHAWQQLYNDSAEQPKSTRDPREVQDSDSHEFARKLQLVMAECNRILKPDGLLVFTYHHSRYEGWTSLAEAMLQSGFIAVNAHPVKSEMSVATPKSQAKEPIQIDNIVVCKKATVVHHEKVVAATAVEDARSKLKRLKRAGVQLSNNDCKVVYYGQLLRTVDVKGIIEEMPHPIADEFSRIVEIT